MKFNVKNFTAIVFLTIGLLVCMALMNRADAASQWIDEGTSTNSHYYIDANSVGYNDAGYAVLNYKLTLKGKMEYFHAGADCTTGIRFVVLFEYPNSQMIDGSEVLAGKYPAAKGTFAGFVYDVLCGNTPLQQ